MSEPRTQAGRALLSEARADGTGTGVWLSLPQFAERILAIENEAAAASEPLSWEVRRLDGMESVRDAIQQCQQIGHVQQVAFSTYHDALTQVCWSEHFIRTNLLAAAPSPEPPSQAAEPDALDQLQLPERVVVDQHGHYWREYGTYWSMCPVSDENVETHAVAVYIRAEKSDAAEPHLVPDYEALADGERDCAVVLKWWQDLALSQGIRAERAERTAPPRSPAWPSADDEQAVEALARLLHGDRCTCPYSAEPNNIEDARRILTALARQDGRP